MTKKSNRSIPSHLKPTTPSLALLEHATPISQGAEAKVYKGLLHPAAADNGDGESQEPVLLKYRFHKEYRHPSLDASLTKSRVTGEARALLKCLRAGVNVPGVRMVDVRAGVLGLEWIEGRSVRFLLGGGAEDEEEEILGDEDVAEEEEEEAEEDPLKEYGVTQETLMEMIGTELAKMHQADIVHGDLTTSNMMLRHPSSPQGLQLVLIDFGLSYTSTFPEDKAVDLYVLERAFASTHPASEALFGAVLAAYARGLGTGWERIGKRLDEVRLRGRKRSMVG